MANIESIKAAVRLAEDRAAWASNAVDAIRTVPRDYDDPVAPWVLFHQKAIEQLVECIDAIAFAVNRELP